MQESVTGFVSAQISAIQQMTSSMASFVAESNNKLSNLRETITEEQSIIQNGTSLVRSEIDGLSAEVATWAERERNTAGASVEAAVSDSQGLQAAYVVAPHARITSVIAEQQAAVARLEEMIGEWAGRVGTMMTSFAEQQSQFVSALGLMVLTHARRQEEERAAQHEEIAARASQQQASLSQSVNAVQAALATALEALVQGQHEGINAAARAVSTRTAQASKEQESFLTLFTSAVSEGGCDAQKRMALMAKCVEEGQASVVKQCDVMNTALMTSRLVSEETEKKVREASAKSERGPGSGWARLK